MNTTTDLLPTDTDAHGRRYDFTYRERAMFAFNWDEAEMLAKHAAERNNPGATVETHRLHITPTGRYAVEVTVHRPR